MFAIGIGQAIDRHELDMIASDHDHTFQVHKFDDLNGIHQNVLDKICASKSRAEIFVKVQYTSLGKFVESKPAYTCIHQLTSP